MTRRSFQRSPLSHPPAFVRERHDLVLTPAQAGAVGLLFQLRAATHSLETRLDRWLGEHSLTLGRFQVLNILRAAGRPLPQREIVEALGVSRATVSALVGVLVAAGQVTASSAPTDKREVRVELTRQGQRLIEKLTLECAIRLEASISLSEAATRELTALLGRLSDSDAAVPVVSTSDVGG